MIFVCSMGDLFHPGVPMNYVVEVVRKMQDASHHTFLVLTKRPGRMKKVFDACNHSEIIPNIWLGVTAENQEMADERIPILLQIPAAVRFVSVEPMLGPVDLTAVRLPDHLQPDWAYGMPYGITFDALQPNESHIYDSENHLDWVICGGETGPHARPVHPDWVRNLRDQCQEAGTSFFFKSWGKWMPANNSSKARDGLWVHENGDTFGTLEGEPFNPTATAQHMVKVGKQAAGRLLDGREWNEMPGRSVK